MESHISIWGHGQKCRQKSQSRRVYCFCGWTSTAHRRKQRNYRNVHDNPNATSFKSVASTERNRKRTCPRGNAHTSGRSATCNLAGCRSPAYTGPGRSGTCNLARCLGPASTCNLARCLGPAYTGPGRSATCNLARCLGPAYAGPGPGQRRFWDRACPDVINQSRSTRNRQ